MVDILQRTGQPARRRWHTKAAGRGLLFRNSEERIPAKPNRSMEPTGASRSRQLEFVPQPRLAPAAHADR